MEERGSGGQLARPDESDPAFRASLEALHSTLQHAIASSRSDPAPLLRWLGIAILTLAIGSRLLTAAGVGLGRFEPVEFVAVLITGLVLILTASGVRISTNRTAAVVTRTMADSIRGMWVNGEYRRIPSTANHDRKDR